MSEPTNVTDCRWCADRYPTADRSTGLWHLLPGGVDARCENDAEDDVGVLPICGYCGMPGDPNEVCDESPTLGHAFPRGAA